MECDRFNKEITIKQTLSHVNLNPAHFVRFKKSAGLTPHQYETKEEIEKAKRLLKNRDIFLPEIAADNFTRRSHMEDCSNNLPVLL